MRILIIEDENKTALYLQKGLDASGFIVDIANNGEDGLHLATEYRYDLVILDVMLPKVNGWAVIAGIRKKNPETRVLFLTARNDLEDRIKGLELGADDYLVKPFAFSELLARVRAALRRGTYQIPNIIQIEDLTIDCVKHKVMRGSVRIDLTPKEFSLLVYLAKHTGEVLSRTLIAENVWDIHFDNNSNVIDVALRRMRQKIDDEFAIKLIHTVRGIGYVLEAR